MKNIITITILVLSLFSCKETKKVVDVKANEITSGKYEIMRLQGKELVHTLFFEISASENRIFGKTNCNSFQGKYEINNNNTIKIGPLSATQMYCEENVMKVEHSLFQVFDNTKSFTSDSKMLTLMGEDGTVLLKAYLNNK